MTSTNQNLGKIGPDLSRQSAMDDTTKRNEQQAALFRSSGGAASIQCPTTQGSTQNSIMKNKDFEQVNDLEELMKKAQLNYFIDIIAKNWSSDKIYQFNNN